MTMMTNESYFLYLLLASNAALLAIACVALIRFERRWRRIEAFWYSPTGTAISESGDADVREQMKATQRLEQRLGELQRTVKVLEMKTPKQQPPAERNQAIGLPIENAVRMARMGASVEELTRNCGLNIGEAQLMKKLHAKTAMAANGP
jgi:hypothetical protein